MTHSTLALLIVLFPILLWLALPKKEKIFYVGKVREPEPGDDETSFEVEIGWYWVIIFIFYFVI